MARYSKTQLAQAITHATNEVFPGMGFERQSIDHMAEALGAALALCDAQNAADERNERNTALARRTRANTSWDTAH